jgi:hypothetical protein
MPGESSVIVRLRLLGANTFAAGTDRAAVGMERLGAASTGAAAKVRGVAASTGGVLRGVARFGKGVALVGGVVGFEAGKMAMNFQQAMLMIHTQAGASAGEVKKLSGEVLNLAHTSAMQSPQELANAARRRCRR